MIQLSYNELFGRHSMCSQTFTVYISYRNSEMHSQLLDLCSSLCICSDRRSKQLWPKGNREKPGPTQWRRTVQMKHNPLQERESLSWFLHTEEHWSVPVGVWEEGTLEFAPLTCFKHIFFSFRAQFLFKLIFKNRDYDKWMPLICQISSENSYPV